MAISCHVAPIGKYHVVQRSSPQLVLTQTFAHMHEASLRQSEQVRLRYFNVLFGADRSTIVAALDLNIIMTSSNKPQNNKKRF